MRCPRCEELFPMLSWRPLNEIPKYAKETAPVYKCRRNQVGITGKRGCGFIFAVMDYQPNRAVTEELPDFMPEIQEELV